jgi:hypothetical protein
MRGSTSDWRFFLICYCLGIGYLPAWLQHATPRSCSLLQEQKLHEIAQSSRCNFRAMVES